MRTEESSAEFSLKDKDIASQMKEQRLRVTCLFKLTTHSRLLFPSPFFFKLLISSSIVC